MVSMLTTVADGDANLRNLWGNLADRAELRRPAVDRFGNDRTEGGGGRFRVNLPTISVTLRLFAMDAKRIQRLYARLRDARPKPTTELRYASPFELLIAVILSAQSTDKKVNEATEHLFRAANTPRALLALGEAGLKDRIKTIGLYNTKAANILATCRLLLERHGGEVPRDREALEALPGVGRKTANVILNTAFGEPTIAVDTHIFRIANRTGLAPGKTVREVEDGLLAATPEAFKADAHHWLILHGRYVCTARKPRCPDCPIGDLCEYPQKSEVA
jgi:endonuclease-3